MSEERGSLARSFVYLFLLLPEPISVLFSIMGIPVPSYLVVFLVSVLLAAIYSSYLEFHFYLPRKGVLLYCAFYVWFFIGIVYSPSTVASKLKGIYVLYNTIIPMFIVTLFCGARAKANIDRIVISDPVVLGILFSILFLFFYIGWGYQGEDNRYALPGLENPIYVSRYLGMLGLIIVMNQKIKMIIKIVIILIITGLMFKFSSRAPFFALVIVYLISIRNRKYLSLLMTVCICLAIFIVSFLFSDNYIFESNFYSLYERLSFFKAIPRITTNFLFGSGTGSFGILYLAKDVELYPHNIFLEVFFENGILGLALLIAVLRYAKISKITPIFGYLILYFGLNSLASADLAGNNKLMILLGIAVFGDSNKTSKL